MSLLSALQDLEYPCHYPFKLICRPEAVDEVRAAIITSLGTETLITDVRKRASRNGQYIALSLAIQATSAAQIAKVYEDLRDVSGIVTSL